MIAQLDKSYFKISKKKVLTRLISYAFFEGRPITAPGQWMNYLVFKNHSYAIKRYKEEKITKPVFILGTGRSGTTILGKVLSIHKDIGYLNEPKAIWHKLYGKEDLTGNFTKDKASYYIPTDVVNDEMTKKANAMYHHYLKIVNSSRVVDKYPELIFRIDFVKKLFPDALFILIIRNGWDTCNSIDLWSKQKGKVVNGEVHDWWGRNQRKWQIIVEELVINSPLLKEHKDSISKIESHQEMALVEWILSMEEGLKKKREIDLVIKYEDLVDRSDTVLKKIWETCGFEYDEKVHSYANAVLLKTKPKGKFPMPSYLQSSFDTMMNKMGY